MNKVDISLNGAVLSALPSGALWWPQERLVAVGDLHLGCAERTARKGGALLPPYETADTLDRLDAVLGQTRPRTVVLLGDSFDDMAAADDTGEETVERLTRMAAGRRWLWIAGNHDPGPLHLPGSYRAETRIGGLVFRHIAEPGPVSGEVSAHYHPKVRITRRGQHIARACFLADERRIILPAFGTYTGGLDVRDPAFEYLFGADATAFLTGKQVTALPRQAVCGEVADGLLRR